MLTFMSRSVLVLLMSTTTTIVTLKGASAVVPDVFCVNNGKYRLGEVEERTCDWIGEKEGRRSKICKNIDEAWENCPETCHDDCNLAECPLEKPVPFSGCLEYKDSLLCEYNYQLVGCPESGFECAAREFYTCSKGRWMVENADLSGTCEDGSNQLGDKCAPCPDEKPKDGEECSYSVPVECGYDYRVIGCSEHDELTCEPTQNFICIAETWVEEELDFKTCDDGSSPIGEQCDKRPSC